MRLLKSNDQIIAVRAGSLARLYYASEFRMELDEIISKIQQKELEEFYIQHELIKIIWAMAKAENMYLKKSTPAFSQWILDYQDFDINDCAKELFEEIKQGFVIEKTYSDGQSDSNDSAGLTQKIIVIALRIGMSMEQLNELTTQDLIDVLHVYADKNEKKEAKRIMATPEQAEAYFR